MKRSLSFIFFSIFLLSFSVLALEIILTRVFTVLIYNQFHYYPLSLAMLGLCSGGIAVYVRRENFFPVSEKLCAFYCRRLFIVSLIFVGLLLLTNYLGYEIVQLNKPRYNQVNFDRLFFQSRYFLALFYSLIVILPFHYMGLVIVLLYKTCIAHANKLYFFDLLGAATGAIFAVIIMNSLENVNFFLIISLVLFFLMVLWNPCPKRRRLVQLMILLGLIGFIEIYNIPSLKVELRRRMLHPQGKKIASQWSSVAYMEAISLGGSRDTRYVLQDHESTATVNSPFQYSKKIFLLGIPSVFIKAVCAVRKPKSAYAMATGVGSELMLFHRLGIKRIVGTDFNPYLLPFANKAFPQLRLNEFFQQPGVHYTVDEARSYLHKTPEKFDFIMLGLKGAPYLSNLDLLKARTITTEAFQDYIRHLTPQGVFFSEFQRKEKAKTRLRTFKHSANQLGIFNLGEKILCLKKNKDYYIFFSPTLFNKKEIIGINKILHGNYSVNYIKDMQEFNYILNEPAQKIRTDDNPFSRSLSWVFLKNPLSIPKSKFDGKIHFLLLTNYIGFILTFFLILFPLIKIKSGKAKTEDGLSPLKTRPMRVSCLAYFFCIGCGFMFVEIPLMDTLISVFGNPSHSIAFVLATLLLCAGLGSYLGKKFLYQEDHFVPTRINLCFVVLITLLSALYFLNQPAFNYARGLPFFARVFFLVGFLFPVGLFLGIPFPQGLSILGQDTPDLIPWAWGINGAASVLAINAAPLFIASIGISSLFLGAIIFYLGAFFFLQKSYFH